MTWRQTRKATRYGRHHQYTAHTLQHFCNKLVEDVHYLFQRLRQIDKYIGTSDTPENSRDWSSPVATTGFSVKGGGGGGRGCVHTTLPHFLKTARNRQKFGL